MLQPPGFAVAGKEEFVCRLKRSIYGLKQSARCWNEALHAVFFFGFGFKQCISDPCLYVRRKDQKMIYVLVYVDDMLLGCTKESEIDKVYQNLKEKYEIICLGKVKHFLGYEIRFEEGQYSICLTNYIENIVHRFGMSDAKLSKTPMDPGYIVASGESKLLQNITLYRSLVGALVYVAMNARPDIAVSVWI